MAEWCFLGTLVSHLLTCPLRGLPSADLQGPEAVTAVVSWGCPGGVLGVFWGCSLSPPVTRRAKALALLSAPEPLRSAGEHPTTFDPTVIASRLRQMGDRCNMDFERVSSEALAEVLKGKMEKFAAAVDSLSRRWSDQNPELAYEKAFLSVAVKLVMHVTEKVPALLRPNQLIEVINGNSRVRNYIEACGGWENLDS
ncbi:bcl-2-like protein 15 isoform X1 [Strix aluco]|uniref:bcl-2-like protein 15 isoform X1 n=1 Tax=Strix aluco TaxID=111821 RepID=UPI003DA64E25